MRRLIFAIALFLIQASILLSAPSVHAPDNDYQLTILESDRSHLKIRFQITGYRLTDIIIGGELCRHIEVNGLGENITPGHPRIPLLSTPFILPDDYGADVRILKAERTFIEEVLLEPNIGEEGSAFSGFVEIIERSVYDRESAYPENIASISKPVIARNLRIAALNLAPFMYHPRSRRLEIISELELEIVFRPGEGENPITRGRTIPSSSFKEVFASELINPLLMDDHGEEFGNGEYLFILPDSSIQGIVQPLVDWKLQRGFPVSVSYLDEIGSSARDLWDYLYDCYYNWESPPEYVLLVGDIDGSIAIPAFYYQTSPEDSFPSDYEYTLLEGDDYFPDLQIGRISVRNEDELGAVINKILSYEINPDMSGVNWFEHALLAADTSAQQSLSVMQWAKGVMFENGYEYIDSVYYYSYMPTYQTAAALNQGVGILNFRGWGDWGGWSGDDIQSLTNGGKMPLVFGCAGGTNALNQTESIGEAWLRSGSTTQLQAGIACIGPAAVNTWSKWDGTLDQGLVWGLHIDNIYRLSPLLNRAKFELWLNFPWNRGPGGTTNSVECYYYAYNILGDPGLSIWTARPEIITVVHSDSIPLGQNYIEITVSTPQLPLSGAYAALVKDDEIVSYGYTDGSGNLTLPLTVLDEGDMILTVSAQNIVPYSAVIPVIESPAFLSCVGIEVDDDNLGSSSGNGDGILNPGETVELTVSLQNFGASPLQSVWATLGCYDSLVTFPVQTQPFGDFEPWGIGENPAPFVMNLNSAAQYTGITVTVEAADTQGGIYNSEYQTAVEAPAVELTQMSLPNASSDTLLMPGENTDIILELLNFGGYIWNELTCTAQSGLEGVVLDDSLSVFPACAPGSIVTNELDPLHISADPMLFPGLQAPLTFIFQGDGGWADTAAVMVAIGVPSVFDPVVPMDNYGYYCFGNTDVAYDNAPDYQWYEIDPDYGGPGEVIPLVDELPFRGGSEILQLPADFHFQHYGEVFDQITVCSNGWLSCGASPLWEYRNKPIPAAGEPSGMIAPFWDDLMLIDDGEVYYHYDPSEDVFIVEWSRVRNAAGNAVETFEVVLWDADIYTTPTGDSPIGFYYHTIQDVDYLNDWSTIGILNNDGDAGLQYLYSTIYSPGADTVETSSALYFTTDAGGRVDPPVLNYSPASFNFIIPSGQSDSSALIIANDGEANLLYEIIMDVWGTEGSGGPDQFGYIWIDSDEPNGIPFDWVDITEVGFQINLPHNDSTSADIPFGFQFPFYGNIFESIIVSANGWLSFTSHSSAWNNTSLPNSNAPENLLAGFWDDLDPLQGDGTIYIWGNQIDSLVVSFINVEHYGSTYGVYTYQVILLETGDIIYQYILMNGQTSSATIGIQNDDKTIGLQVAYNQGYVHNNLRVDFQKPWLTLQQVSGVVPGGDADTIEVTADASYLSPGNYSCDLLLLTNDPTQIAVEIPVSLTVIEGDSFVSNLTISVEEDGVRLEWDSAGENIVYEIYRSPAPYFSLEEAELIGQCTNNNYIDYVSIGGTSYFYKVSIVE